MRAPSARHAAAVLAPAVALGLALGAGPLARPATAETGATATATATAPALATLVADSVTQPSKTVLVAEGHVQVLYNGARLTAQKITYDQAAGTIAVEGPMTLIDATGQTTVLASGAELSADLQNGILHSAQMELQQRVQIAAEDMRRVGGRYSALDQAVTSSCRVCAGKRPLWEIRARRVIHDQAAQRIYFDQATLRFAGVPVFYLPEMSLPDPSVKRAQGFLTPRLSSSSSFGVGITMPYFLPLGPSRDVTFYPYVASKKADTLGLRYREAFDRGALEFRGALSRDKLLPGQDRGYLFGDGFFLLPRGFVLKFQLQTVSDPDYFLNYGLTQVDRLESGLELTRTRRDEYIDGQLLHFHSIRSGESNATLPTDVAAAGWIRRFSLPGVGGQASLAFRGLALLRGSQTDVAGRDVSRAGLAFNWQRSFVLPAGIVLDAIGSLQSDLYSVAQDTNYSSTIARTLPQAAVQLSWPWVKTGPGGASQVISPVIQLIWAPKSVATVPNEDSQVSDFDEGNLFSLSHFNGVDGVELGARANVGLTWTRYDPSGWTLGAAAGRIFRSVAATGYDTASGLGGKESDWLVALQAGWRGIGVTNRAVFGDGGGLTKDELRLSLSRGGYALGTSYIWMVADTNASYTQLTTLPTREWIVDSSFPIRGGWSGKTSWRYDFVAKRADTTALLLAWRNECVSVNLSLSRSYASSTSVSANTTFGFSVGLSGFGGGSGSVAESGSCRG